MTFILVLLIVFLILAIFAPFIDVLIEPKLYDMLTGSAMNVAPLEGVWQLSLQIVFLIILLGAAGIPVKHYLSKEKTNMGKIFQDYKQVGMYIFLIFASFIAVGMMLELNAAMTSYTIDGIVEPNVEKDLKADALEALTGGEDSNITSNNTINKSYISSSTGISVEDYDKTIFSYQTFTPETAFSLGTLILTAATGGVLGGASAASGGAVGLGMAPLGLIQYFLVNGVYALGLIYMYIVLAIRNVMVLASFIGLPVGIALKTVPMEFAGGMGDKLIRLSLTTIFLPFLMSIMMIANAIPMEAVGIGVGVLQLEQAVIPLIVASVGYKLLKGVGLDTVQSGRSLQQAPAQKGKRYHRGFKKMNMKNKFDKSD